jgi:hypothetical protein
MILDIANVEFGFLLFELSEITDISDEVVGVLGRVDDQVFQGTNVLIGMALALRDYKNVFALCSSDGSLKVFQKRGGSNAHFLGFDDQAILVLAIPDLPLVLCERA